jgi:hypothetical protein
MKQKTLFNMPNISNTLADEAKALFTKEIHPALMMMQLLTLFTMKINPALLFLQREHLFTMKIHPAIFLMQQLI